MLLPETVVCDVITECKWVALECVDKAYLQLIWSFYIDAIDLPCNRNHILLICPLHSQTKMLLIPRMLLHVQTVAVSTSDCTKQPQASALSYRCDCTSQHCTGDTDWQQTSCRLCMLSRYFRPDSPSTCVWLMLETLK